MFQRFSLFALVFSLFLAHVDADAYRVDAVTPNYSYNTVFVPVIITGAGFLGATRARLEGTGLPTIHGTNTTSLALGTMMRTIFNLNGKPTGVYNLVVRWPDAAELTLSAAFETRQGMSVTGIAPSAGDDSAVVSVSINGSAMGSGATARLTKLDQAPILGASTLVAPDGLSLTTTFDLRGQSPGEWNVIVQYSDGHFAGIDSGFTIRPVPHPVIVTPTSGFDLGNLAITIAGSGFGEGASVRLVRGAESIPGTSTIVVDAGTIATTVDLLDRALGSWDVEVTNPSGLSGSIAAGFAVQPHVALVSVTPTSASDAATTALTIVGRNLMPSTAVALRRAGQSEIAGSSLVVQPDGRQLSATFDLTGRAAGVWDMAARNPDDTQDGIPAAFTILGAPYPTAVNPTHGPDFGTIPITIVGSNFAAGATVRLQRVGSPPIDGSAVQVSSDGASITTSVPLTDQPPGMRDVIVTNAGGLSATLSQAFEVEPLLRVVSAFPNYSEPNVMKTLLLVVRWHEPALTIHLTRSGHPDVVGHDVRVGPDDSVNVTFDLTGAATGVWDLRVENPGGTAATLTRGFTIAAPIPDATLTALWGGCNYGSPPGSPDVVFDCKNPRTTARLIGNFRSPAADVTGVIAISGALDVLVGGGSLPPFWHLESGGCNSQGISVSGERDESVCPAEQNSTAYDALMGPADAFITAYGAGVGGNDRARLLWAVIRSSNDPVTIVGDKNYFAFEIRFVLDNEACVGCDLPVNLGFTFLLAERAVSGTGGEAIAFQLVGDGRFPSVATINGGVDDGVVPARLPFFEAEPHEEEIEVRWQFSASANFTTVDVERRGSNAEWQGVAAAMPVVDNVMSLIDYDVIPGARYEYRLMARLRSGGTQVFGPVSATVPLASVKTTLLGISPNPLSGRATIDYVLDRAAEVRFSVVDVQGRERSSILGGRMPAGRHSAEWDGRFDGVPAPTGVYFMRCELEGRASTRRIAIVR